MKVRRPSPTLLFRAHQPLNVCWNHTNIAIGSAYDQLERGGRPAKAAKPVDDEEDSAPTSYTYSAEEEDGFSTPDIDSIYLDGPKKVDSPLGKQKSPFLQRLCTHPDLTLALLRRI